MNTTEERDQFLEEIRHKKRVLQSEKGRLDAAKKTYKNAQEKQVFCQKKTFSSKFLRKYSFPELSFFQKFVFEKSNLIFDNRQENEISLCPK